MSVGMAGAGVELAIKLIQMIGDAKEWRLEIRKWAYDRALADKPKAEALEAWVDAADAPVVGRRREALKMWAWDANRNIGVGFTQHLAAAQTLYEWGLLAEARADGEDVPEPPPGPGFGGERP